MKFFIATDHAGIAIKPDVIALLNHMGHEVIDLGPFNDQRVDYPDYAHALVLEDGLEGSLGDLGLVGSIGGEELAAAREGGHDGGNEVVVRSRPEKPGAGARGHVLGRHGLDLSQDFHLREGSG